MATRTGTGFIGLQEYLDANGGAIGNTAHTLADAADAQGAKAQGEALALAPSSTFQRRFLEQELPRANTAAYAAGRTGANADPGTWQPYADAAADAQTAKAGLDSLTGGFGQTAANLQKAYGTSSPNGYSAGDRRLDANLLGASSDAQSTFKDTQAKYGGLDSYLDNARGEYARGWGDYTNSLNPAPAAPRTAPKEPAGPVINPGEGKTKNGIEGWATPGTVKNRW